MKKKNILLIATLSILSVTSYAQEATGVENNTTKAIVTLKENVMDPIVTLENNTSKVASQVTTQLVEANTTEAVVEAQEEVTDSVMPTENNTSEVTLPIAIQEAETNTTEAVIIKVENNTSKITPPITIEEVESNTTKAIVIPKEKVISTVPEVAKTVTPPKVPTNDVTITMPSAPLVPVVTAKVPKLIILDSSGKMVEKDSMEDYYPRKEKVIFSDHVAPPRFNIDRGHRKVEPAKILAGDIDSGRVSAYLHTSLMSVDAAKEKLTAAGFKILSTFKVDKKGTATSVVFTNDAIIKAASKTIRGFAGTLRLTVDKKNELVVISNPLYLMKAFMQEEYDKELAETTLKQLRDSFSDVKNSKEIIKFRILERFRFMENMPYYQDMKTVAEATNTELLARAKKSKKVVFEQTLENGSIILGVQLGKRTSKFVKKIGYQNSGLLPYPVLIENSKAYILAPQYYIAVMYPELKMSQFMKIATVPGAIAKDIDKIFR